MRAETKSMLGTYHPCFRLIYRHVKEERKLKKVGSKLRYFYSFSDAHASFSLRSGNNYVHDCFNNLQLFSCYMQIFEHIFHTKRMKCVTILCTH